MILRIRDNARIQAFVSKLASTILTTQNIYIVYSNPVKFLEICKYLTESKNNRLLKILLEKVNSLPRLLIELKPYLEQANIVIERTGYLNAETLDLAKYFKRCIVSIKDLEKVPIDQIYKVEVNDFLDTQEKLEILRKVQLPENEDGLEISLNHGSKIYHKEYGLVDTNMYFVLKERDKLQTCTQKEVLPLYKSIKLNPIYSSDLPYNCIDDKLARDLFKRRFYPAGHFTTNINNKFLNTYISLAGGLQDKFHEAAEYIKQHPNFINIVNDMLISIRDIRLKKGNYRVLFNGTRFKHLVALLRDGFEIDM